MSDFEVGDIVVQAKHAPDGYRFKVLEVVEGPNGTILRAQPLDGKSNRPAQEPVVGDLHVILDVDGRQVPLYDEQGQPVTQRGATDEMTQVEPVDLNAATVARAED